MDFREEEFWYREAAKRSIERRADLVYAVRVAMSEGTTYSDEITRFKWQLMNLEHGG